MIGGILIGLAVGFVMSIPPGPISVAIIRHGIQGKRERGAKVALGAALIDVAYAFIAATASSAIIRKVDHLIQVNGWLEFAFQIVCIIVLVAMGYRYFRASPEDVQHTSDDEEVKEHRAERFGATTGFMLGILMAVMNLANPSFLPSLIAVAGFLHAEHWISSGVVESLGYAAGFGAGVFLWFTLLLRLVMHLRTRMSTTFFMSIFKFAGGTFFLFALILLVRVVAGTDWAELLK